MSFVGRSLNCRIKERTSEGVIQYILPGADVQQHADNIRKAQNAYAEWIICPDCKNPMFDIAQIIDGQLVYQDTTTQAEASAAESTKHTSEKHRKKLERAAAKAAKAAKPAAKKARPKFVKCCAACPCSTRIRSKDPQYEYLKANPEALHECAMRRMKRKQEEDKARMTEIDFDPAAEPALLVTTSPQHLEPESHSTTADDEYTSDYDAWEQEEEDPAAVAQRAAESGLHTVNALARRATEMSAENAKSKGPCEVVFQHSEEPAVPDAVTQEDADSDVDIDGL